MFKRGFFWCIRTLPQGTVVHIKTDDVELKKLVKDIEQVIKT